MEEEYLILQCPACERSVKIRSDAAGTRMGCPYCKAPIEVGEPGAEDVLPDEEETEEEDRPPLEFRRIQSTESNASAAATQGDDEKTGHRPKGERRKHRKRHTSDQLDWDSEKKPAVEQKSGDHIDDDSSEFLEMDPDTPGGVRLKRVRRKKLLTKKDKFLRGLTASVFVAAAVIAGVVIYSAVMQTSKVIGTETKTLQELPDEIRTLIDTVNEVPITDQLTRDEEEAAAEVLSGFLNAKTIDERLEFVRDSEKMRPLMEKWYADNPEEATKEWPDAEILLRKKIIDQERYFVVLAVEFIGVGQRVMAIEQLEGGEMKLDWPTTVGYQPVPIEHFKAERPTEPVKFWVKLKPSEYYNFGYSDKEQYQAFELSYPGREFKLVGYVDRSKEWATEIIEVVDNGEAPSLIVELKYPEPELGQLSVDESQVEIVSVISQSWWE